MCNKGFFDEDCSAKGVQLTALTPVSIKIPPNSRGLFYMEMDSKESLMD